MNKLFFSVILFLLAACGAPSQPQKAKPDAPGRPLVPKTRQAASATESDTASDPVLAIRHVVEYINTQKLAAKHTEFRCDALMKVDRFYDNGEMVKITVDFGNVGDVYAREDYYYDHGKLVFKYEFVEGGPACEGCIEKNEYRSYIRNDKVIRYLKDQRVENCRTCSFEERSRYYRLLKARTDRDIRMILCR